MKNPELLNKKTGDQHNASGAPKEPHFLEPYQTHVKPEAITAAEKKERLTGQTGIVQDRSERISAYLERLEKIFLNEDTEKRKRNIALLRPLIHKNILIKKEVFPDSYFEYQKKLAKERGLGDVSFNEEEKKKEIEKVMESQRLSLDAWIDYLTGDDAKYPIDIKYFAMQGILNLGNFDTDKYFFTQREKTTTASFAEIDREALSMVMGALEARHHNKPTENYSKELLDLIDINKNFGDMYALAMRQLDERANKSEMLSITDGEWKVFEKDSQPQKLVDALAGKRSNLCIADIGSATRYLSTGSIEVYFSYNRAKQPVVPRIAIATNTEMGVYEVRGTYNKSEDIDPLIGETDVLTDKLKGLKNGESFAHKDECMKEMTEIYNKCFRVDRKTKEKTYLNPTLTKDELTFLYEINNKIEGFGYDQDPRIKELRDQRDPQKDAPIVLGCKPEEIAYTEKELNDKEKNKNIKAYIGVWNPTVLKLLSPKIEYVYESFPDKKVFLKTIETDPNITTPKTAEKALLAKGFKIYDTAKEVLQKTPFSQESKEYDLVSFSVGSLGFPNGATTKQIYKKAEELGLDICPAEVGPLLRLNYSDQPNGEYLWVAMKSIEISDGHSHVFRVLLDYGERWLSTNWDNPGSRWDADYRFVFLRRK